MEIAMDAVDGNCPLPWSCPTEHIYNNFDRSAAFLFCACFRGYFITLFGLREKKRRAQNKTLRKIYIISTPRWLNHVSIIRARRTAHNGNSKVFQSDKCSAKNHTPVRI